MTDPSLGDGIAVCIVIASILMLLGQFIAERREARKGGRRDE